MGNVNYAHAAVNSIVRDETMEETLEEVKEIGWDEVDVDDGKYFRPGKDQPYNLTIADAGVVKNAKFKDKDGNPKIQVRLKLATINGEKTALEWRTGSWSVIREIKKCVLDKTLKRSVFLLKMKNDGNKTIYVFEKTGEVKAPSKSAYSPDDKEREVGAFL